LLAAAARLIATRGADVSLRAVAQEAGVGIATLYRHFPTRDDLIGALIGGLAEDVAAATARFHSSADPVPERWGAFVQEMSAFDLGTLVTVVRELHPDPPGDRRLMASRAQILDHVGSVLAVAHAGGVLGEDVTPLRFMLGFALITQPLPSQTPPEVSAELHWVLERFLDGLRPAPR
jgi:AcrR family transcriptional regulator